MSIRYFLLLLFVILGLLTALAIYMSPKPAKGNKIPIIWTTDPNPQRDPQVAWFNKLYPKNHLSIDPDNSGVMKVVVQSSAGMGPDVIGQINENSIQIYHGAGILWDVTEQAKKMGFGPETLPESVRPFVMMRELNEKGELVKRQYVYPCNVYHRYIFYNKNIFDKYHIPYPPEDLTWEEYIKIAKKLTIYNSKESKVPDIFGGAGADAFTLIWEKGGDFLNKDGTRCLLNSKAVLDALVFLHDLYYKYGIEPTPNQKAGVSSQGGWGSGYISWFGEGKVAMYWGARYVLIQLRRFVTEQRKMKKEWIKANPNAKKYEGPEILRMGACLVPRFKDGKRYTRYGARCAGINKNSKNKEEALKFLQYLASKEYSKTINDGADSKPGNKKYITIKDFMHKDWPEERQLHEMSIKATPDGRTMPRSLFVSSAVINRNFKLVTDKIISDPNLTREDIKDVLKTITENINLEIARNIKRNPKLMKVYKKMLEKGAEPIAMDLKNVD